MTITGVEELRGVKILLGVSSSIAAFRALDLASRLRQAGAEVRAVLTPDAAHITGPAAFDAITHQRTIVGLWGGDHAGEMDHLAATKWADLFIIAPATANTIAMLAHGLAPNALGTFAVAWNKTPLLIAPAMNPEMWHNAATRRNVSLLQDAGHRLVGPEEGRMACDDVGAGRLASTDALVSALVEMRQATRLRPLAGKRVAITAGPTREFADDVRCITNPSTGRMGIALARQASLMGAQVALILGPTQIDASGPWEALHRVESADDMLHAAIHELQKADMMIFSAAVSDWRPAEREAGKQKKTTTDGEVMLRLVRTPDIAATCAGKKRPGQVFVGFAAESVDVEKYAREKMERKGFDLVFGNAINEPGVGFGGDTNAGILLDADGARHELAMNSKEQIARTILHAAALKLLE